MSRRDDVSNFLRRLVQREKLPMPLVNRNWLPGSTDDWPFLVTGAPYATLAGMERSAADQAKGRGIDHTAADTVDKIDVRASAPPP